MSRIRSSRSDKAQLPDQPQVGVRVDASFGYGRSVFMGILRYARTHTRWKLMTSIHGRFPLHVTELNLQGILAMEWSDEMRRYAEERAIPAVNVSSSYDPPPFPSILPDNLAIGRMAAEHLLQRGIREFGYYADPRVPWGRTRLEGFSKALALAGRSCHAFQPDDSATDNTRRMILPIPDWIGQLPRPVGVFCGDEPLAWTFIGTAQDAGVDIPEQMAVVAAGNDELICRACDVPLSGVDMNTESVGYQAASELDRQMRGGSARPTILVPPRRVVSRQSSDILAIEDPHIAAAVRMINQRACDPLSVDDILKEIPVNRRWLERNFKKVIGRTIQKEIMRVRIEKARQILLESNLPMEAVARECGFAQRHHMGKMFRRLTGTTPAAYRRAMRTV